MTALHTPAPWACDLDTGDVFHADDDVCPLVATVNMEGTSQEQFEADCRLIARAPAVVEFVAKSIDGFAGDPADSDYQRGFLAALQQVQAVIAGGQA